VEADEALRKSRESLGFALGSSDAWGVNPQIKLDTLRADARATCAQGETIEQRPDILAAVEGEEIARRNVKAVTFDYLPTLSAETILTYTTNELQTANRKNITWTIGAMFSWHIFDGGLRSGERRQNQGVYEQQSQQAQKSRLSAQLEVTQSYRGVNVAKSSLEIAKTKRDVAMSSAKLSRIKFVNGTGSSFDLVDTQSTARQSELDVTVKEFELLQAEIAAFLALASCEI
jgi:outer membrane protein TolC